MGRIAVDDSTRSVLEPVRATVERGLEQLPPAGGPVHVELGNVPGFFAWHADGRRVVLSEHLAGPALHHPDESPAIPVDRWRRAAASVLEGVALLELSRRCEAQAGDDWRWTGAAAYAAHRVAPELGIAHADLAVAIATGHPGGHPRAGGAVMQAWHAAKADPLAQAVRLLKGGVLSAAEWLRLGAWVLSPRGGRGALPVQVEPVAPRDVPCALDAWSWQPLLVPGHSRGGRVVVQGAGAVDQPWARADHALKTLAAAVDGGCSLVTDTGGPVGTWEVASAEGFGQVMGARGVRFEFSADGRLQVVLADAFVGPLAAVGMADRMGTSGTCSGRWCVAGEQELRFVGIETHSLTMHGRRDRFAMPAKGFGMGEWLMALGEGTWVWGRTDDGRLLLRGRMLGGEVQVRLRQGR